ncbi:MAG: glucan biosynthesis protein D, partial [Candidatus Competibacter sp.]|nr:glucan biosynthesis protein D [Candidatus Competibacter sp.]
MIRRDFLTGLLSLAAWGALPAHRAGATNDQTAPAETQPFSKEWLRDTARRLAQEPYQEPADARPPWLAAMSWDDYQ